MAQRDIKCVDARRCHFRLFSHPRIPSNDPYSRFPRGFVRSASVGGDSWLGRMHVDELCGSLVQLYVNGRQARLFLLRLCWSDDARSDDIDRLLLLFSSQRIGIH